MPYGMGESKKKDAVWRQKEARIILDNIMSKKSSKGLSSIRPIRDGMESKKPLFPKKLSTRDGR